MNHSLYPPYALHQHKQHGAALLIFVLVMLLAGTSFLFSVLNSNSVKIERDKKTAAALAEAKAALIGVAISTSSVDSAGFLTNPDTGVLPEGSAAPNMSLKDLSLVGKFPWRTLGASPLKDGSGECVWYVVSGRYKKSPKTSVFNWDTQGQIDVIDVSGNVIATNLAALIISPDSALDAQNQALADSAYVQCRGNYDARNYLDTYDATNAIAGAVNYFTGSTNNRLAPDTNNKQFVLARNDHYNDKFLFVTVEEIFRPIIRRADFLVQIQNFLGDNGFRLQVEPGHLETVAVSSAGTKGADNIDCNKLSSANKTFCKNWKEMLLLTEFSPPSTITIDGVSTVTACTRVLIFGGQKIGVQTRLTAIDKNDPANYLEGANLIAFAAPIANANNFVGVSTFNASNPSADVLKCLP
ncbi:MAG: hypothetical protein HOP04_11325 [Methylophilaceae bacterium]|nr:hypothetical protein [Methylophilaceae bacterium]